MAKKLRVKYSALLETGEPGIYELHDGTRIEIDPKLKEEIVASGVEDPTLVCVDFSTLSGDGVFYKANFMEV